MQQLETAVQQLKICNMLHHDGVASHYVMHMYAVPLSQASARACRLCTLCGSGALGDERHLVFECGALAGLRAKYAQLFEVCGHNLRAFFAHDYLGVF